jgi:hypothetical protein
MTEEQFQRRWLTLSYDRTKEQDNLVKIAGRTDLSARQVFGRNGVGRFAGFCFGSQYGVITWAGGKEINYLVKRGVERPISIEKRGEATSPQSGTTIEVVQDGLTPLSPVSVRSELGKRFLTDPAFEVSMNGVRVDFEDIAGKGVEELKIEMDEYPPIRVVIIDAQRTDRTTKQHGIAWHVNGRLVGNCGWSGNGFDDLVDGRRIEAKRYTFIIFADQLANTDAVKPDWTGFNEDNEAYKKVRERVLPTDVAIEPWKVESICR